MRITPLSTRAYFSSKIISSYAMALRVAVENAASTGTPVGDAGMTRKAELRHVHAVRNRADELTVAVVDGHRTAIHHVLSQDETGPGRVDGFRRNVATDGVDERESAKIGGSTRPTRRRGADCCGGCTMQYACNRGSFGPVRGNTHCLGDDAGGEARERSLGEKRGVLAWDRPALTRTPRRTADRC